LRRRESADPNHVCGHNHHTTYNWRGQTETDFCSLRARYTNPATARFLSVDPAMGPDDDADSAYAYLYAR